MEIAPDLTDITCRIRAIIKGLNVTTCSVDQSLLLLHHISGYLSLKRLSVELMESCLKIGGNMTNSNGL